MAAAPRTDLDTSSLKPHEEWARRIVSRVLDVDVELHDDNSRDGMYDLRVGPQDGPELAIECVGAVDPVFTEAWNVGPARGPQPLGLIGDWIVGLRASANYRRACRELRVLLGPLDNGPCSVRVDHRLMRDNPVLFDELDRLGVRSASCYRFPGKVGVSFTLDGRGGAVDTSGSSVPGWITEFFSGDLGRSKVAKLERSGARFRHVFIWVTLNGVPWPVESYLTGDVTRVLPADCSLPDGVDGVWVCPTHAPRGLFWAQASGWVVFDSRVEQKAS